MKNKARHLEAYGKGEYIYDYENDILLFKIKDREYKKSLEFENLVVDIDKEDFITGLRIFDASKVFDLPKVALKNVKEFEFHTEVEDQKIRIQLRFKAERRNKPVIKQGQDFWGSAETRIKNSEVVCTVA